MRKLRMAWGEMAYWDNRGSGCPLVLLHGTGCDSEDWDGAMACLPGNLRVIRMDFRCHGASDTAEEEFTLHDLAADVLALAEHLELQRMLLVGHSLGGIAALAAAARSPLVAGMVLLEGWTNVRAGEAFPEARLYGGLDKAFITRIEEKSDSNMRRFRPAVFTSLRESVQAFDAFPYLQTAAIPIVEVYGDAGRTRETEQRLFIPNNPRIAIHWIKGAGHYLPHEKPREVAQICRKFAIDLATDKR